MRTREKRNAVRLSARMRSDTGWSDVRIHNVSGRGMLLTVDDAAPALGSYLEVRRGPVAIVAKTVWRNGHRFGVRTQDRIDLKRLIDASRTPAADPAGTALGNDRRITTRADAAARSRTFGRLFQYVALLAAIGAGTIALAGSVASALAPLRTIEASLISG